MNSDIERFNTAKYEAFTLMQEIIKTYLKKLSMKFSYLIKLSMKLLIRHCNIKKLNTESLISDQAEHKASNQTFQLFTKISVKSFNVLTVVVYELYNLKKSKSCQ